MADRDTGDTWKAGLNWRPQTEALGEDTLVYALWGEGFRPGFQVGDPPPRCDQDNDGIIDVIGLPWNNVISDELESLEFGYKASFAQRRVSVEAAVFDIDWTGLRVDVVVGPPCGYTLPFNAGAAESKGFEFAFSALLTDRLQLDLAGSWLQAELANDSSLGTAGSRLPGSPEFNASLGLQYGFELAGNSAWLRGDAAYVGGYYNTLAETPPRLGDYATLDLSGGMDFERWSLELYVKNLTNSDALTWANPIFAPYDRQSRLRPRTIGARLRYTFGVF
jgi:outer membrane receptor protein involved in Fe transport